MLSYEQIESNWNLAVETSMPVNGRTHLKFARAIETAACAERDARIVELEERNRDLYEDVQRFKEHALNEKAARLELERDLAEAHKALHDAATSLNTISDLAGHHRKGGLETFMDTFLDVRLYARSRHQVARDAINAYYLEPHVKQAHEALRAAMKGTP